MVSIWYTYMVLLWYKYEKFTQILLNTHFPKLGGDLVICFNFYLKWRPCNLFQFYLKYIHLNLVKHIFFSFLNTARVQEIRQGIN